MIVDEEVYLEHFGVKGMKWGIRKQREASGERYRAKRATRNSEGRLTGRQRVGAIAGGYLIGSAASWAIFKVTRGIHLTAIGSLGGWVVGSLWIRKRMIQKHGKVKVKDL